MVTNKEVNEKKEPGCIRVLTDKKYFHVGNLFLKRTLREHEWQVNVRDEIITPSPSYVQRWMNEAAALQFLSERIDVPLPKFQCAFHDDGAFHLITEFVDGVNMSELQPQQKEIVMKEVEEHVTTLHSLRSTALGGLDGGFLCPPYRVFSQWKPYNTWSQRRDSKGIEDEEYVFCHNDLSQHNIIVDPDTLKIKAIVDWEFAGFWPKWFEAAFWKRSGPSVAINDEGDDSKRLRGWLLEICRERVPHQAD
ncbi:MAG: hypothetical protein M1837_006689 [Sclerophora amabilis]|nr:MAG: hypothetical protein M1837_006689 [Sclerophora amabilis]